ncbi:DUF1259 domain-containing protein [Paenibacillus sp. HJL G12]|uniref:DUF1259 domain-containing protein n=1 Tax=Paenibacillus dendrobii TaxID=2691084 RepID=A0A7X3II08_9BACL|nr:DUF1259 domain-containing protein [Paenibacillus dendrobii]MWV42900.1 DUF1259 domain-containing protein [Paenibacillus dendrobii]
MNRTISLLIAFSLLCIPAGTSLGAKSNDCKEIEHIFKTNVKQVNGVCKLGIMRHDIAISILGVSLSPDTVELGFGANFENVGDQTAVIGEFALLGSEVNRVIDTLRKGNIEISALHNHQIGEQPQILYLHFQALGKEEALAGTVKAAIEATNRK